MKNIVYRVVDKYILAVAVIDEYEKDYGTWTAYIGIVHSTHYDKEKEDVPNYGTKIAKTVAEYYFDDVIKALNKIRNREGKEHVHWCD